MGIKVALVSQILAHYREPIIRLLCEQEGDVQFTFFADPYNTINSVETIDATKAGLPLNQGGLRWRFVKNIRLWGNWIWQRDILRLAVSNDYDTVIYMGDIHYISTWISCLLARICGKRTLMWSHGFLREEKGLKGCVRSIFYRLAHGMLLYGDRARDIMVKKGFDPRRLYVVYNSLDYERQSQIRNSVTEPQIKELRGQLFRKPDMPILLFIGRLTAQKRLDMILYAAHLLRENGLECNLLFVGDGLEKKHLEALAIELKLSKTIYFHGCCYCEKEIAPLIMASDLCVAPGEVGLTAIHALTYGTPVITHNAADCQMPEYEAIIPGKCGAFFKRNDITDLAHTIHKWLKNKSDLKSVLQASRGVVESKYSPRAQLNVIINAIKAEQEKVR